MISVLIKHSQEVTEWRVGNIIVKIPNLSRKEICKLIFNRSNRQLPLHWNIILQMKMVKNGKSMELKIVLHSGRIVFIQILNSIRIELHMLLRSLIFIQKAMREPLKNSLKGSKGIILVLQKYYRKVTGLATAQIGKMRKREGKVWTIPRFMARLIIPLFKDMENTGQKCRCGVKLIWKCCV